MENDDNIMDSILHAMDYTDEPKTEEKKKHHHKKHGEAISELSAVTALRSVKLLKKALNKIGGELEDWRIRFHTRGFDILDIKIKLIDKKYKNIIADILKDSYPGTRHHFDDNPSVYAFLAVNNKLGKMIRNKLGLDYAAYDDGRKRLSISITEPAFESPPENSTLDDDDIPDAEKEHNTQLQPPPQDPNAMGGADMGGGMGGGLGGAGGMGDIGMDGLGGGEDFQGVPLGGAEGAENPEQEEPKDLDLGLDQLEMPETP